MPDSDVSLRPMGRIMAVLAPGVIHLVLAALLCGGIGLLMPDRIVTLVLFSVAGTLLVVALAILGATRLQQVRQNRLNDQIATFIAHDASPAFLTDEADKIVFQNRAAIAHFGTRAGQPLAQALSERFAEPASALRRLRNKARAVGVAREDLVSRCGHVRLGVHRIGQGVFLWRMEDMSGRAIAGCGAETISLPMLTASSSGTILCMNEAMRRLVGERMRNIDRIFPDLPIRSGEVHEIATANGPLRAVVAEMEGAGGRSDIYLLPVPVDRETTEAVNFDTLPVALMRLDGRGQVQAVNLAAREFLGRIVPDTTLSDLFEGLGRPVGDWVDDALAGRADRRPEVLRVRRGDREVFLQVTLARVVEGGRPGLIGVLSDATQLKTLEAQFVQSQKMQAIGQLAGGVAHDFNNLLTAISGHSDLLMLRHDKGDPDFADLDQISQNANRAASLVGQLLAFSRKQTLKPQILDLRDILSDLTHLLNRLVGEKVVLSLSHDVELSPVRADKRQLEQVIMNLVVNARDAMPGGGEIRIRTENLHLNKDNRRDRVCVPKGSYVVVKVTDEGTGIASDKLDKIFEPFFTTKRTGEGTGLGLSTAYGIIKQTGGYIFCDTVPGSGTCFTICLPAHDGSVQPELGPEPEMIAPGERAESGNATVLLVEDEAPVRAFASRALKLRGYTVLEAESAEEALERLSDTGITVDIFLTDVIMPGMDGPTWVDEALKARPGTKVVFMSGYAEDSFRDGKPPVPNSVFLPKPFSLSELIVTVQDQLD